MSQEGEQMRVGAYKGFAYYSVKLVLLANANVYYVDFSRFFFSGKAVYPFEVLFCPNSDHFRNTFVSIVCEPNLATAWGLRKTWTEDTKLENFFWKL
jgi:hypothetical protein